MCYIHVQSILQQSIRDLGSKLRKSPHGVYCTTNLSNNRMIP
ncbi:hypothetical protein C1A50_2937 [Paenibacillus polymyxa]|nr:hypothetical protein C1A50_2937 [Paenibacillus polymyxa]